MKTILYPLLLLAVLFAGCSTPSQTQTTVAVAPGQDEVSYQVFYDELSPYGRWIDYPGYGYVWVPAVEAGFHPYVTNGHWEYSNEGWTWASNYNWGWASFHYGRWFYEDGYGWMWTPGHEWAPAWVTWGQSGGNYGWAPLGPRISAEVSWTPPVNAWTFVPQEHLTKPNVQNYVIDRSTNVTIVKNVTIINNHNTVINNNITNNNVTNNHVTNNNNNTRITNNVHNTALYNIGPHINEVEKNTNTHIQQVNIRENDKPAPATINNNNLNLYRPHIMREENQQQMQKRPTPARSEKYAEPGRRK